MSDPDRDLTVETQDTHFLISPCPDSPIPSPRRVLSNLDLLGINECVGAISTHSSANSTRSSSLSSINSESIFEENEENDENVEASHHKKERKKHSKKSQHHPKIIEISQTEDFIQVETNDGEEDVEEKLPDE